VLRRVKRRYLGLKVVGEQLVDGRNVMDAIWKAVLQLFGEYGASQVNLSLVDSNPEKSCVIVRCSHKALDMVRASVASITEIDGKPAAIHVLGVSGTLRALRRRASL
jgi:ribonuclease P/MRP protein subunit POP5